MSISALSTQRTKRSAKITEVLKGTDYLTERLIKDGFVLPVEREVVRYGLETLQGTLSGFILSMIIGFAFGNVSAGIVLYFLVFPLRKYAGGYHADTRTGCLVTSVLMMVVVFFSLYLRHWSTGVYVVITVLFDIVILLMAPIGNQNKRLDNVEKRVYRKKTRGVLLFENLLFILTWLFHWQKAVCIITMSVVLVGVSLMMGLIKLFRMKNY